MTGEKSKVERHRELERTFVDEVCNIEDEAAFTLACDPLRAEQSALWATMTDAERAEAGVPRIECAVCHRDFGPGHGTQAADCASMIHRGEDGGLYLTCHYGSDMDGDAYEVVAVPSENLVQPPGPLVETDPVCDACVRGYAAAGALREIGDYLHDKAVQARVFRREP